MVAPTARYIGLRTWRYSPPTTSRSVGAVGAGVPRPSKTKRPNACRRTPVPRTIRAAPRTTTAVAGFVERQPVSSHGTRPATTPGATSRNRTLPSAGGIPVTAASTRPQLDDRDDALRPSGPLAVRGVGWEHAVRQLPEPRSLRLVLD